jgi:hypothetical protein
VPVSVSARFALCDTRKGYPIFGVSINQSPSFKLDHRDVLYIFISRAYWEFHRSFYKALLDLDPGGGFASETAARQFQRRNCRYVTVSEVKRLYIYNGYM